MVEENIDDAEELDDFDIVDLNETNVNEFF